MKQTDIDILIEHIHANNAQQRQSEMMETASCHRMPHTAIAAVIALIILVAIPLLWPHHEQLEHNFAQVKKVTSTTEIQGDKNTQYSYTKSDEGIVVFCEDHCDPDEVIARLSHVMKTLDNIY